MVKCSVLARIYRPRGIINHSCHAPHVHAARHVINVTTPLTRIARCEAQVPLSIMPPKTKKPKLVAGQKTLSFAQGSETTTALPSESTVSPSSTVPRSWDVLGTPSSRCGAVASWRAFAAAKWCNKHPWVVVEEGGVYCLYCKAGAGLLSGSSVFVSTPFTGTRPDKLVQHEHSESHQAAAARYREGKQRLALGATVSQVLMEADMLYCG